MKNLLCVSTETFKEKTNKNSNIESEELLYQDIKLEYVEISKEVKIRLSKEDSYSSGVEELNFLKFLFE